MKQKNYYLIGGAAIVILLLLPKGKKAGIPPIYQGLVDWAARKHNVRPELIAAIVEVESGWNPKAYRPEPRLKDASRGLGQILLGTARQYGFKESAEFLFNPAINLDWMALILRSLWDRYKNTPDTVAAYNAGSARKTSDGRYVNQAYVDKVMKLYGKLRS